MRPPRHALIAITALVVLSACSGDPEPPAASAGAATGTGSASPGTASSPSAAPAIPPSKDGVIVFSADTGSGFDLYTIHPDGEALTQLTATTDADEMNPDWSPDGSALVFELDRPFGAPGCSVVLAHPDGGGQVDLTFAGNPEGWTGCEGQPSFTPDGRRIVFTRVDPAGGPASIWTMDLAGKDRQEITDGIGLGVTDPNVSPDGGQVSFVLIKAPEVEQALAVVGIDGSGLRRLTSFALEVAIKQDWAPDGKHLVLSDHADDESLPSNVETIRPDGTGLRALTDLQDPAQRAFVGSYSPDGAWIVFRLQDGEQAGLFRMRPDGSDRQTIIPMGDLFPRYIAWGPPPPP
jgi:Tol biopolymer transport system component